MADMFNIDQPGIYDMTAEEYHADPCPEGSLSNSSAKLILPMPFKGCPAKFDHARNNPPEPKKIFDFGHVAHKLVLGRGDHIKVLPFEEFRTKEAKKARDAARAAGQVPIKSSDFDKAQVMAEAVFTHPFAGKLFEGGVGEQSLFWRCSKTGIMCRCRLDYLPTGGAIIPDYKTTGTTSALDDIQRTTDNLGYWMQAAWYLDGIKTLGICESPSFVFVFQEVQPPHIVTVAQLDPVYIEWGYIAMLKAREMFAECQASGNWSAGYHDDVVTIEPPGYSEHRLEAAMDKGAFDLASDFQGPLSDEVKRTPITKRSDMEIAT